MKKVQRVSISEVIMTADICIGEHGKGLIKSYVLRYNDTSACQWRATKKTVIRRLSWPEM